MTSSPLTLPVGAKAGVAFEDYARIDAVNWHTLEPFRVSALEGRQALALPDDPTDFMKVGGAFHTAILEPEKFDALYAMMPTFEGHASSNIHKAAKAKWIGDNGSKIAMTKDEMSKLRGMQRAVMAHPTARALLTGKGRNELTIIWKDAPTGVLCKGRVDRLTRIPAIVLDSTLTGDCVCMVDLKKTSMFHRFDKQFADYGYHGQFAFYTDGLSAIDPSPITPLVVAMQESPPHDVAVYTIEHAVEHGRRLYRRLLNLYLSCRKTNVWPGVCPVGTMPIVLPKWSEEPENEI